MWALILQIKIQWIYAGTGHFEYPAMGEAFQSLHLTRHQRTQAGCVRSREIQLAQTAWGMADSKCLWVSLLQICFLFFSLAVQAEVTGFLFIYKGKKCIFYFKQSIIISQELERKNIMKLCVTLKLGRAGDATTCSGSMGLVYVCESSEVTAGPGYFPFQFVIKWEGLSLEGTSRHHLIQPSSQSRIS